MSLIRGCLVVIARHKVPKQSLKAIVRLLSPAKELVRRAGRFARNDNEGLINDLKHLCLFFKKGRDILPNCYLGKLGRLIGAG